MIYFVYKNTEFYRSPLTIVGTYFSKQEAIQRIESFHAQKCNGMHMQHLEQWRTDDNSISYFIKSYPIGDCNIET